VNHPRFFNGSGSFTLTEILTATAVLSVLFTIMFGILQQTSNGWQAANRRVEASQAVRLAFEQICQDLEHCYPVRATNVPLPRMGANATNLATNATSNYAFGFVHSNSPSTPTWVAQAISQPNDMIFVVTSYAPSVQMGSGDLAEVGYVPVYVTRSSTGPGYANTREGRYVLLRSFPLTIPNASGNAPLIMTPLVDFYGGSTNWESTPGVAQDFTRTNFFPVVDNCIGFDVSFWYRRNGTGPLTPTNVWGRPEIGSTNYWPGSPSDSLPGLPAAARVTLCVVDERTAERIYRLRSNGLTAAQISNVIASVTNPAALSQIPDDPPGMRNVLRQGVIGFQRTVYFKYASNN